MSARRKTSTRKNSPVRPFLFILIFLTFSGCSAANYETLLRRANSVNLQDGLDQKEAVLIAQKHVILTGLDQDVSIRRAQAKLMNDQNFWLVTFNDTTDNKVGPRRREPARAVIIQVNRTTGTSALFTQP